MSENTNRSKNKRKMFTVSLDCEIPDSTKKVWRRKMRESQQIDNAVEAEVINENTERTEFQTQNPTNAFSIEEQNTIKQPITVST